MRSNISHIVFVLFSIEYMSTRIDFSINSIPFGGIIVVNELGKVLIWFVYDPLDYQTFHVAYDEPFFVVLNNYKQLPCFTETVATAMKILSIF